MLARHLLVLSLLAFAACGGGGASDEEAARAAVTGHAAAIAGGDFDRACELTSETGRAEFTRSSGTKDCPAAYAKLAEGLTEDQRNDMRNLKVTKVTINGEDAVVISEPEWIYGPGGQALRKSDGEWQIAG